MNCRTYRTRNVLNRQEAGPIITPYVPRMNQWLSEAWAWMQEKLGSDPTLRKTCDLSIQAALVYNQFIERMTGGLVDDPNVVITKRGRMSLFTFDGVLRLRFKKFTGDLRSRNVRTNSQASMYWQLQLPNMEDRLTDVTYGYVTDTVNSKIIGVYMTCPIGWKKNKWFIPIVDPNDGQLSIFDQQTLDPPVIETLPTAEPLPTYAAKPRRDRA